MELLQRALDLTEPTGEDDEVPRYKLRAVTLNNIGCWHRKRGQPREALATLERALRLLESINDAQHAGDTHLNICAVLSQSGRHSQALEHAQTALILLQEELYLAIHEGDGAGAQDRAKRFGVLAIAYHNVAVEQEYLGRVEDALSSYSKAAELARSRLGANHPISGSLAASLESARQTWADQVVDEVELVGSGGGMGSLTPGKARKSGSGTSTPGSSSSQQDPHRYHKSTTRQAVARLSKGHPASRAPIRPKSASHAMIKRREGSPMGASTDRSAVQAQAVREAERLYGAAGYEADELITPRGEFA